MTVCIYCGRDAVRRPRSFWLKVVSKASFSCPRCESRWNRPRALFFFFQRYVECPLCKTRAISQLAKKDRIDPMLFNPLRRLLALFGASIYHCTFCRVQFRDWRKLDPRRKLRRSLTL